MTSTPSNESGASAGVAAGELAEDDLVRELEQLHATRNSTLLHGSEDALDNHTRRMQELEQEYLRRHPQRDVDPQRLRSGARERGEGSAGAAARA